MKYGEDWRIRRRVFREYRLCCTSKGTNQILDAADRYLHAKDAGVDIEKIQLKSIHVFLKNLGETPERWEEHVRLCDSSFYIGVRTLLTD